MTTSLPKTALRPGRLCPERLARVALLVGVALALAGCGSLGSDRSLQAAQVRLVEVAPGSPDLDLYLNGTGTAYGVGFESFTSYLPVMPGPVTVALHAAGAGQPMATATAELMGGRQYTVVATRRAGTLQQQILADADSPAPAGHTALRLVNAVAGTGSLVVHVAPRAAREPAGAHDAPVRVEVGAGSASGYLDLPAGPVYEVTATLPEPGVALPLARVTLPAISGGVRTVVFGGTVAARAHAGVVGFALADADLPGAGQP